MPEPLPEEMRALRLHEKAGPEGIVLADDVPVPQPGIGDVLIRVEAASLTPTELGWPSTWVDHAGADRTPVIPCHEVCGEVVGLGYGTVGFEVGDDVFGITDWYRDGAAAEYVTVEARNLAAKPSGLDAGEAAALALPGLTAQQGLFALGGLTKGETVLIPGATGGVGAIAVQLARNAGATVVAAGHAGRAEEAHALGADEFVDVDEPDAVKQLGAIDLVFDLVGGDFCDELLRHGVASRAVSIVRPHDGLQFFVVEGDRRTLEELARLVDEGALRPVVSDRVSLADGAAVFTTSSGAPGKRVIETRT